MVGPGKSLTRFAWLSIAAAVTTIGLKTLAWALTGSVGMLSDAIESGVNLLAALTALGMLTLAARPPDEEHAFGHEKAEYFSSGVEGALILFAAVSIAVTSWGRLVHPQPLEKVGVGLAVSMLASLINLGVARVLLRAGRRHESITLEADAHHLMTDVWTSAGVLTGIGAVALTGWQRLDPIIALLVAANIVRIGVQLMWRSNGGLMDSSLAPADREVIVRILDRHLEGVARWHGLRTRQAAARRFVTYHLLVPGAWTVREGHDLAERIEADLRRSLGGVTVFTHLEAVDDPAALEDQDLDHPDGR